MHVSIYIYISTFYTTEYIYNIYINIADNDIQLCEQPGG